MTRSADIYAHDREAQFSQQHHHPSYQNPRNPCNQSKHFQNVLASSGHLYKRAAIHRYKSPSAQESCLAGRAEFCTPTCFGFDLIRTRCRYSLDNAIGHYGARLGRGDRMVAVIGCLHAIGLVKIDVYQQQVRIAELLPCCK